MKRIREKKDITAILKVKTNKEEVSLVGRDIAVHLIDPKGCAIVMPFEIVDDIKVEFTFWGTMHKILGTYAIVVWENLGKKGQTAVDKLNAFQLVPNTDLEGGEDPEGLDTEVVELEVDLSTGVRGADGVGVADIKFNADYTMTITLTDGTIYTSPSLRGETGATGATGPAGRSISKIEDGTPWSGVHSIVVTYTDGTSDMFNISDGEDGNGIKSIVTSSSSADGGINTVTITLDDGTTKSFNIRNGSKGSTGPTGATGPAGSDGVSITSVEQTTTSTADSGINEVKVTKSDGTSSTFQVRNGSKGSTGPQGIQGIQGIQGETGPTGPQGPKGDTGDSGIYPVVNQTAASVAIEPNVLNLWGEMAALTITLATPTDTSVVNEYMGQFTSGSTPTEFTYPSSIVWSEEPSIEANSTYQFSIINNLGIIVKF